MARVFEGLLKVSYGQAYVLTGVMVNPHMEDAFRGQTNGLCGAAAQGALWLVTGLNTGQVGFTVDVLDAAPPIDDAWEEIVEVSFTVAEEDEELEYDDIEIIEREIALVEWAGERSYPIPLGPGSSRARYCARGMEFGSQFAEYFEQGVIKDVDEIVDFYALSFWPAIFAEDRIIKQTSEIARYWHEVAQSLQS